MNVIDLSLFHLSNMDIAEIEHLILEGQAKIVKTAIGFLLKRAKDIQSLKSTASQRRCQFNKLKKQVRKHKKRIKKLSKMHLVCESILSKLSEIRKIVKEDFQNKLHYIEQSSQLQLSDLIEKDASGDIEYGNYIVSRSDSGFCNENQNIFNDEVPIHQEEDIVKQQFYKFSNNSPRLNKTKSSVI